MPVLATFFGFFGTTSAKEKATISNPFPTRCAMPEEKSLRPKTPLGPRGRGVLVVAFFWWLEKWLFSGPLLGDFKQRPELDAGVVDGRGGVVDHRWLPSSSPPSPRPLPTSSPALGQPSGGGCANTMTGCGGSSAPSSGCRPTSPDSRAWTRPWPVPVPWRERNPGN